MVTDTHALVWYITAPNKLPAKVKKIFDAAVEGRAAIFIPAVVLWEMSLLLKAGQIRLAAPLEEYVQEHFFAQAISILDIETEDIQRAHSLAFSRDPFDVLIVAMTLRVDCPLITADGVMHEHKPCDLFWH
ncbi:MAG: type II toxin-antitoxin system VapC family toxin [Candidatus Melainabacteria bacterium]|nr:type II toxin-antitoxin system VapC family toxin [Candidatus Melainabacteria bacterium]